MNTYIDIESIPEQPEFESKRAIAETISHPAAMKKAETIREWNEGLGKYAGEKEAAIDKAYRSTSFNGAKGQICSISFAVADREIISFTDRDGEKALLSSFVEALMKELDIAGHGQRPPFFIGHYLSGFDLKFLFHRLVINGIQTAFDLHFNGRHDQHYYDTMIAWAGYKDRISQDNLCKALGIEGKPDGIDGSKVWDFYKEGRIDEIEEYNRDDVDKVRQIHKRLTFSS
jgi:hypothetical protein